MHQLLMRGRRRPGLLPQPAHLCTACLVAFGSSSHASQSAAAWANSRPACLRRQLRAYTTPTQPLFFPVLQAEPPPSTTSLIEPVVPTHEKENDEAKKKKGPKQRPLSRAVGGVGEGGRKPAKATKVAAIKAAKAAKTASLMTGGAFGQTQLKLWRETLDVLKKLQTSQDQLAEHAAAKAAKAAETAKAVEAKIVAAAARHAKLAESTKRAKEANETKEEREAREASEAKEAKEVIKIAKAAKAAKAAEAVEDAEAAKDAKAAAKNVEDAEAALAAWAVTAAAAANGTGEAKDSAGDALLPAAVLPSSLSKKAKKKVKADASKVADAAADAAAAEAAVAAAKNAQEQVKLLTNALHLLKNVLSTQGPQDHLEEGEQQQHPKATKKGLTHDNTINARRGKGDQDDEDLDRSAKKKSLKKKASLTAAAANTSPEAKSRAELAADTTKKNTSIPRYLGAPRSKSLSDAPYRVFKVNSRELELTPVEENMRPVPKLHYGLDRALFNPGVYHLQDPRSRVFNFDPYLATIMPLEDFDFNALKQYVTSSKDTTLIAMAEKYKMKYSGSTSSMTSMLSHFHFLLSSWRPINPAHTTRSFTPESLNFTRITKAPAATFLHWKDGTYAIDADKEYDSANILSMLGKSMEKLLTLSKEDFEKYRVTKSHELTDAERNDPESFHYTTFENFMMRSQLDAYDSRLPGTGMFDLKTRAVVSIRMDAQDFHKGLGYEIRSRIGQYESFEREYYDMIRSAFLKYSLQVRMGRMDGIYVAFHNTQRIFGFQYISINEMDLALHGTEDSTLGDREFLLSLHMFNAVLEKATARFPGRSLRLHIETRPSAAAPFMYVFATPVTPHEIEDVQSTSKESIEAFERNILNMGSKERGDAEAEASAGEVANGAAAEGAAAEGAAEEGREREEDEDEEDYGKEKEDEEEDEDELDSLNVWETMRQRVEETMENEAQGIESVRDTIEDALEQSGLLRGRSPDETRAYIDALLEAVTATDTKKAAETILKGQDADDVEASAEAEAEVEAETEAEDQAEADVEAAAEAAETELESNPTEADADSSEMAAATDNANTSASEADESATTSENEDSIIDEDGDSVSDSSESAKNAQVLSPASSSSSTDTISLKDLIMKLAAQVEAAQSRDASVTTVSIDSDGNIEEVQDSVLADASTADALVDAPKNKRFERILSQMLASSIRESKEEKNADSSASPSSATDEADTADATTTTSEPSSSSSSTSTSTASSATSASPASEPDEVLGMIVTLRNKVNGRYVARPENLTKGDSWVVEYAIEEIAPPSRARDLYGMLKRRRKGLLVRTHNGDDASSSSRHGGGSGGNSEGRPRPNKSRGRAATFNRDYLAKLYALSAKGRRHRRREDARARSEPVKVYGLDEQLGWGDVFPASEDASEDNDGDGEKDE